MAFWIKQKHDQKRQKHDQKNIKALKKKYLEFLFRLKQVLKFSLELTPQGLTHNIKYTNFQNLLAKQNPKRKIATFLVKPRLGTCDTVCACVAYYIISSVKFSGQHPRITQVAS